MILEFVKNKNGGLNDKILWEIKLSRNAYNMCVGPFGKVQGRELICVQSIDGMLMIIDNK